ncbi:hypothetical protein KW794_01700 [Candidatus Saccharibacteria bacterium]|nr:hypothetical protein [Candidatus Saccharibacteria bacterium]
MNRNRNGFSTVEALLILVIIGLIGFTGWFVYHSKGTADKAYSASDNTSSQQISQDKTKKSGLYFRNKYQNNSDQAACLDEYYATYPESKPENQKPGKVYLSPPCPGIPQ